MSLILYELAGADPEVRFSAHCWKSRMALAHKGLHVIRSPWRFVDKEAISFSGQQCVPILVDGNAIISNSFSIAEHLEKRHADRPSLFGGESGHALARFVNLWVDTVLAPKLLPLILLDIYHTVAPGDQLYFRESREQKLGVTLEQACTDRAAVLADFRMSLAPMRLTLENQPFLSGEKPLYGDYCIFGAFMWARTVSAIELLESKDPLNVWLNQLLDAFSGMARRAPRSSVANKQSQADVDNFSAHLD